MNGGTVNDGTLNGAAAKEAVGKGTVGKEVVEKDKVATSQTQLNGQGPSNEAPSVPLGGQISRATEQICVQGLDLLIELEYGHKGLLGHVYLTHGLHALLTLGLFLQ